MNQETPKQAPASQQPAPSPATIAANRAAADAMQLDSMDEEEARRGFLGTRPEAEVRNDRGEVVWSMGDYAFLHSEQPPATVHPALWRQARLNRLHGLFEVTPGIYQVRGFDISNMTIIEGRSGLIVIDPLTCIETARAALDLYCSLRAPRAVVAVIYSHSHTDHFGGVAGIVDEQQVRRGEVAVIAPSGFMEAVYAETVAAGPAMARRAQFQFGHTLRRGPCGQVDAGLGKTLPRGRVSLIAPTELIREEVETRVIDGVEIVFQLAPQSEAPAEMHFHFPALRALNLAENATKTLHNLCPLRGSEVRDPRLWSMYLNQALERFVPHVDVVFAQHHWPTWGRARIERFVSEQRDMYRFLHDQTLRLMNRGRTGIEIAESLRLPRSLEGAWHARGFYGSVSHNVKSIYTKYLGWYDGNPLHLHLLPDEIGAARYVEYMGGADAILQRASADLRRGEFRWVAEVTGRLLFAEPDNLRARELAAQALEQMGFQAQSATWRNAFLLGAHELLQGKPTATRNPAATLAALPEPALLELLGTRIDFERCEGLDLRMDWSFDGSGHVHHLVFSNSALTLAGTAHATGADVSVRVHRSVLERGLGGQCRLADEASAGAFRIEGDAASFVRWLESVEQPDPNFSVVLP